MISSEGTFSMPGSRLLKKGTKMPAPTSGRTGASPTPNNSHSRSTPKDEDFFVKTENGTRTGSGDVSSQLTGSKIPRFVILDESSDEEFVSEKRSERSAHQSIYELPRIHENRDIVRSYSIGEDLKIIDFYRNKDYYQRTHVFDSEKKGIALELSRSYESIRDRYKRYLKYLLPDELEIVKAISRDDPDHYYIHFERIPDMLDKDRKKFKDVSREEPTLLSGAKKVKKLLEKKEEYMTKTEAGEQPEEEADSGRKRRGRPKKRKGNDGNETGSKQEAPSSGHGYTAREDIFMDEGGIRVKQEHQGDDYYSRGSRRSEQQSEGAHSGMPMSIEGTEANYPLGPPDTEEEKKNAAPEIREVAEQMNVTIRETLEIFDAVSHDIDDLRAYASGKKELAWSKLEDEMVLKAQTDEQLMHTITLIKGEESVGKRLAFLRSRQALSMENP